MVSSVAGFVASPAEALPVFVGSWEVGQDGAPVWSSTPTPEAYSGVEAAALLFGGSPSDYRISTAGSDPLAINDSAWYSVWGSVNGNGAIYADDYKPTPFYNTLGVSASAYVADWCGPRLSPGNCGPNYAFRAQNVPGPLPSLGVAAAFGYSRKLRKRILSRHGNGLATAPEA